MSDIEKTVVEYISTVQPELEKFANERTSFFHALDSKLTAMVKAGSLTEKEANVIIEQTKRNPANIFNHLDIPAFNHRVGSIDKEAGSSTQTDPLYDFAFK